jgi:very-short-patch-repair endonuclease
VKKIDRARELRGDMTEAETKLWWRLRQRQLNGHRFKQQVPIGPYIVDFACLAAKLVIEVDGGQHVDSVDHDERRTAWLEERGYRVLRFWNPEVLASTDEVLEAVLRALPATPPPRPSPSGGEGEKGERV